MQITQQVEMTEGSDSPTRDRILLEAARLFRLQGYEATSLRQVADACSIKAGSVYYHFGSKEEILVEVLDKGIQVVLNAVRQRVEDLPANATARERIAAAVEGHLWGVLQHGDFSSANIRTYGQAPIAAKNRHRKFRREYADYWHRLLEDGLSSGDIRTDGSIAVLQQFVVGALNWTVEWYNPHKGAFEDFAKQVTSIVFDGIAKHHVQTK